MAELRKGKEKKAPTVGDVRRFTLLGTRKIITPATEVFGMMAAENAVKS